MTDPSRKTEWDGAPDPSTAAVSDATDPPEPSAAGELATHCAAPKQVRRTLLAVLATGAMIRKTEPAPERVL